MASGVEAEKFTQHVVDSFGPATTPRMREIMGSLVRHLHAFARDCNLQYEEWEAGVKFMNSVGQASTPIRNEGHRLSDVLGLESLVTHISYAVGVDGKRRTTTPSILGPFWSPNAPFRELGETIATDPHKGHTTWMYGTVTDLNTGKPIEGAIVDIWQASSNGKYDFQDPENQSPNNLRGKFKTGADGKYYFQCLKPTGYSLPHDGPAWQLLQALDRHSMRPAHIHLMISAPGYTTVTTQLYPRDDPYTANDTVFAVTDELVVDFVPNTQKENGDKWGCELELHYPMVLEKEQ